MLRNILEVFIWLEHKYLNTRYCETNASFFTHDFYMFSALMMKVEDCIIKTIVSVELPIATAWKIKQTQKMSASNVYAPLVYHSRSKMLQYVYRSPGRLHTRTRLSHEDKWNLLSFVNNTDSQSSISQLRWIALNSSLWIRWARVKFGPVAGRLAFIVSFWSLLRMVWVATRCSVASWNSVLNCVAVPLRFRNANNRI